MRVTVDTNVLLRAAVRDDLAQAKRADQVLGSATRVIVTLSTMCEFVFVLGSVYKLEKVDIANAIQAFLEAENVQVNVAAVEAGLLMLAAGGDFADGVITYEGQASGAELFLSFDKQAVKLAKSQGYQARLP